MTRYGRELSPEVHGVSKIVAERARPHVGRAPTNETQEKRQKAMNANKVLIRPHDNGYGREVFDVVKLVGGKVEEVYVKNATEWEEAAQLALMCMAGRTTVSLGNARTLLRNAQNGMVMPEHGLSRPIQGVTRKLASGDFEVLPPAPPQEKKPVRLLDARGEPQSK